MKKKELVETDPIWQTLEYSNVDEIGKLIILLEEAPENVVKRYEMIYTLIEFSKFNYEFLDLAYERALSTFELALRSKYIENNQGGENDPLAKIIDWANENNITYYEEQQLNRIRNQRNSLVGHPKRRTVLPPDKINKIYFLTELINSIYNAPAINASIKEAYHNAHAKINELISSSIILTKNGVSTLVGDGYMVHYDYRNEVFVYLFVPLFNINPSSNKQPFPGYISILSKDIIAKESEYNEINGEVFQIEYAESSEIFFYTDYQNKMKQAPYLREVIMANAYHEAMKMIIEINKIVNQKHS